MSLHNKEITTYKIAFPNWHKDYVSYEQTNKNVCKFYGTNWLLMTLNYCWVFRHCSRTWLYFLQKSKVTESILSDITLISRTSYAILWSVTLSWVKLYVRILSDWALVPTWIMKSNSYFNFIITFLQWKKVLINYFCILTV